MQRSFGSLDLQTTCSSDYQELLSADRLAELTGNGPVIARGAGLSYVAASFGADTRSIGMGSLSRVTSFEPEAKRITVEAGISLGALYDFLLPHHLFLSIQPGYPQITVGGCVACNVHGKNPQRDGVFADVVEALALFHPDHGVLALSRTRQPELFELTCGGFGLTGVILTVTLRLTDFPAPLVQVRKVAVRSMDDACDQITEANAKYDFVYTWHDLGRFDARMGRGFVLGGRFVSDPSVGTERLRSYRRLDPTPGVRRWRPKIFHRRIIPWATRLGYMWQMLRPNEDLDLFEVIYPGIGMPIYFDLYGSAGFFGHMVLVPDDRRRDYVRSLERVLRTQREPIFCASMKSFDGKQRLLHFNGAGVSMHFHIPNSEGGRRLIGAMEDLSRDFGLIRNIYFDSRLSAAAVRALYPECETFHRRLVQFDPKRRFKSELSRRLDI